MRWRIVAIGFLLLGSTHLRGDVQMDEVMPLLADLAARGGYGVHSTERGAFLVRDDNGDVRCVLWPFTGQFQKTAYVGRIPEGTIAIAHTHPRSARFASGHDTGEAARLGLPILVVSWATVQLVDRQGTVLPPQRGVDWGRLADRRRRCSAP